MALYNVQGVHSLIFDPLRKIFQRDFVSLEFIAFRSCVFSFLAMKLKSFLERGKVGRVHDTLQYCDYSVFSHNVIRTQAYNSMPLVLDDFFKNFKFDLNIKTAVPFR